MTALLPLALYYARPLQSRATYIPDAAGRSGGGETNPTVPHRSPEGHGLDEGELPDDRLSQENPNED